MSKKHIVVDISGHGLGHLGQISPVITALLAKDWDIDLTLRSQISRDVLKTFIKGPFDLAPPAPDIGMKMITPYQVDRDATHAAYLALHENLMDHIEDDMQILEDLKADLLISNVGYVGLAAQQARGRPNMAICSLNWADIFAAYCFAPKIEQQIRSIYQKADLFLKPTPSLEMKDLAQAKTVGPLGRTACISKEQFYTDHQLDPNCRLILYSLGGIKEGEARFLCPEMDGVIWIIASETGKSEKRKDCLLRRDLDLSFLELLSLSDAVVTKPGYGIFVESVLNRTRILSCVRPDWPETGPLTQWAARHTPLGLIGQDQLETGRFRSDLQSLLDQDLHQKFKEPLGMHACLLEIKSLLAQR